MQSTRDAVAAALAKLDRPLPLSTLGTRLRKSGIPLKNDALRGLLDELVRDGLAFEHPVTRRGRNPSPCYWHGSAEEYVRGSVGAALPRQMEWSISQLRRLVSKAYHDLLEERLGVLLEEERLFEMPLTGKTRKFRTKRPRAREALTAAQLRSLTSVLPRVNALRQRTLRLEEVLSFLDGEAPSDEERPAGRAEELTEDLLLRFYADDLPRRGGLRSMPIPWTWSRYASHCAARGAATDLAAFHALLRALHGQGRVGLAVHDAPASVPEAKKPLLPAREDGRLLYYWTPITGR
jgi:hypothetical protein